MTSSLSERLQVLAVAPVLLVACDYDGTLAELTDDPSIATPDAATLAALRSLRGIPWTSTAVVSGRAFSDLSALLGIEGEEWRIGSHGAEWRQAGVVLTESQRGVLSQIALEVTTIVDRHPGLRCERKPAGVVLHLRQADRSIAEAVRTTAVRRCRDLPGVNVRFGKDVVEFVVVPTRKNEAIERARKALGATAVLFIGDDCTDEDVFQALTTDDVSIRVGPGETAAQHRVSGVAEVTAVLLAVASMRREWANAPRSASRSSRTSESATNSSKHVL